MKNKISPSMMCVDFAKLSQTIKSFEKGNIDYLHIDIMDGNFVPNITLGTDFCKKLRKMTSIPLDIHLMIERPDLKLDWFDIQKDEIVSVHYESTPHIQRTLQLIKDKGAKPFLALCPGTPVEVVRYVADIIDGVLIMTVNPGFSGQKLVPACLDKIKDCRKLLDSLGRNDVTVEVDGNVGFENSVKMSKFGADMFVGGSSSVFFKEATIEENIEKFYKALKKKAK